MSVALCLLHGIFFVCPVSAVQLLEKSFASIKKHKSFCLINNWRKPKGLLNIRIERPGMKDGDEWGLPSKHRHPRILDLHLGTTR